MNLLQIYEPGETPLPHVENTAAVGIDLGTTNSLVAIATGESAEVVHNIHGHALLPSVVYYDAKRSASKWAIRPEARADRGEDNVIALRQAPVKRRMHDAGAPPLFVTVGEGACVTPVEEYPPKY